MEAFEKYLDLLVSASSTMNLTAIREPDEIRIRHFEDSLSLLNIIDFKGKSLLDIGSGAGFPGLALKLAEPTIRLTLLEATGKKVEFLRRTITCLGLKNAVCVKARAEEFAHTQARESFDIVTARGVAALPILSEISLPFLKVGGYFLAMKENAVEKANVEKLGGCFQPHYSYTLSNGISHSVIIVKKVTNTSSEYPRFWSKIKASPLQ